eukprot:341947_1
MPHVAIMFHCSKSNQYHKNPYDLCEACSKKKSLKVLCKHCEKIKMDKIPISSKHKASICNQCRTSIRKSKSNTYIYHCSACKHCIICIKCAKNPSVMQHQQQQYLKQMNRNINTQEIMTTLHGYAMIGPYTPDKNQVWYCDNKTCQYTKHGLYRKYRIENWRSSRFGKSFVLCDGCVRQYPKQQPIVIVPSAPQVHVAVNYNPNPANQGLYRSDSEIISHQPEGVVPRSITYM